jgi:hypothetical protein
LSIRLPERVKRRLALPPSAMVMRFGWQQFMMALGAVLPALV